MSCGGCGVSYAYEEGCGHGGESADVGDAVDFCYCFSSLCVGGVVSEEAVPAWYGHACGDAC